MDKITLKLTRYFMLIITLVVAICLFTSSIFLSKFYLKQQYDNLEASAKDIYNSLEREEAIKVTNVNAILINGEDTTPLTHGKMGMMPFLRVISESNFKTNGIFENGMGDEFLYYKLDTDLGEILVFDDNKYSSEYLRIVYIFLFFIFILAIILSLPIISFVGKKFTKPILKLQDATSSISKGNFDIDCSVNTNDEIELLSMNLNLMASELKKKYQLQRDFIANVSHDFKTPLSVIRSYSEAINDGILDESHIKKYSGEVIKEVDRLNSLVMDLLQLSKLQDGAYTLAKEYIKLPDLIKECINQFKPILNNKKIYIETNIEPIEIYADKKFLQRVLYNFIDNAIKFSYEEGKLKIYTTYLMDSLKISVKDYGIGIEGHLLEEVWNKYYKNAQSGGMGLGLPICKEILKSHGFEYGANSSKENGTEFYFVVPKGTIRKLDLK